MPRLSISSTYNKAINDITVLERYRRNALSLPPNYQHFIAEVIMLRLFSILENSIKNIALKLACKASYKNGVIPNPIVVCNSLADAENKFKNYNRRRPVNLKWTKASYINNSIQHIIPGNENFPVRINNFSNQINEMRIVRNHIAHRTSSTRIGYKTVIFSTFGAYLKIQTGAFLTSTKRIRIAKIDEYIRVSKIILNDITNG